MRLIRIVLLVSILTTAVAAFVTIFGSVRGYIHDTQHRPIQGAMVMLNSQSSDWTKSASTDANGEFAFNAVPLGDYSISVASPLDLPRLRRTWPSIRELSRLSIFS